MSALPPGATILGAGAGVAGALDTEPAVTTSAGCRELIQSTATAAVTNASATSNSGCARSPICVLAGYRSNDSPGATMLCAPSESRFRWVVASCRHRCAPLGASYDRSRRDVQRG